MIWGYFFGRCSDLYGDNLSCPGSVAVVVPTDKTTELAALERAKCAGGSLVIGRQMIAAAADAWDKVKAVYVASEADELRLELEAQLACREMRRLSLPHRPIISYSAENLWFCPSVDWLGVQAYPAQGVPLLWTRCCVTVRLNEILQQGRRPALIWGAYDRRRQANGAGAIKVRKLLKWQKRLSRLLQTYRNIEAILIFSDGRPGGCRDHPELRVEHQRVLG